LKAAAEPQVGAKTAARRRRKKVEGKKLAESAGTEEVPEDKTA